MECRQIRELLLADYRDGRAKSDVADAILRHLESCAACRKLESDLNIALKPLEGLRGARPPADLWEKIKLRIEPRESFLQARLREAASRVERFFEFLHMPRYALASVTAAVVIAAVFVTKTQMTRMDEEGLNIYLGTQASFMEETNADDLLSMDLLNNI